MDKPLVSLIIPTYNRAHYLGETLESIISQTYDNWECIVVDDGSKDHTKELLGFYCDIDNRITYHKRPVGTQKGPNSCRNLGFELSKGDFINFIDSDDILLEHALEKKIKNIKDNNVLISTLKYIDQNKRLIDLEHKYISKNNLIEDYFIGQVTFYTFTPFWERSFLEGQAEMFDEKITNLDDWDFNLRMLYQKPKIDYLHEPLILYRLHEESLSREINKLNFKELKSEFNARKKHFNLLKKNKEVNLLNLKIYDKNRCKSKLRAALAVQHPQKFSLLGMLLKRQILLGDFTGLFKAAFGYFTILCFKKGDRLLR